MKTVQNFFFLSLVSFACLQNKKEEIIHKKDSESSAKTSQKIVKEFREGDIIFQNSKSSQSRAIELASQSNYTHCGILYQSKGKFYVFEAVQPITITPLEDWIKQGEKQHYTLKRLKDSDKLLSPDNLTKMKKNGEKYLGKNYDLYFSWSDERMYCSELVWKIYKESLDIELGKLQKLGDFDLKHPEVIAKLKERYGNQVPLNEKVISPAAIFNADKLVTVFEKNEY